jgi:2-(3-amino-3-carboxypropyl)histidine synthase
VKVSGYDIDLDKAVKIINKKNFKKVVLQIPEGLKIHFTKFVEFLEEKTNADVLISASPCFGACDLVSNELKGLGVDLVVQIGHEPINDIKTEPPTLFINVKSDINISKVVEKVIPLIKDKKIGLVSTAQHAHKLEEIKKILENKNFEVFIGRGDSRISLAGQILGCNFSSANSVAKDIDLFLFIGSGNFHPLGLMLSTKKKVIACDPYTNEVKEKELEDLKDMVLKQRYGAIARAKNACTFGILVGTKSGQQRIKLAFKIKEKLNSKEKKSYIFTLDNFTPVVIQSFLGIDCFISTACPRIAIDDYMQYKVPIITPVELDILLGYKKWEEYGFDEILSE